MSRADNRQLSTADEVMMEWSHNGRPVIRAARSRSLRLLGALLLAAGIGACDVLDRALEVEAPGVVDASTLEGPESASLLVTGAIADFECALGAYIVNGGLLGNELRDASVTSARFPLDQRIIDASSPYGNNSCTGNPPGIYEPLSKANWATNNILTKLEGWSDAEVENRTGLIAEAAAYSGYTLTLMGEGFCSAVIEELGPEVFPPAIFEAAEARFTRAIEAAQEIGDEDILNMARLGRARVRLNLGDNVGAAADARDLLASDPMYEKVIETSDVSGRRENRVGDEFFGGRSTVDPSYHNLTVAGVPDPRVEVINTGVEGHDSETIVFIAAKYGDTLTVELRTAPLPLATWREARLIIAEAEGGQEAEDQINILRDYWDLPFFLGGSDAEIEAQVIEERSRELFLEGQHLNDLRRFELPLIPAVGEDYRQGGTYGDVRCFPLPDVERLTNPNVT